MKKLNNKKNVEVNSIEDNLLEELVENVHYLLDSDSRLNINVKYLLKNVEIISRDLENFKIDLNDMNRRKNNG